MTAQTPQRPRQQPNAPGVDSPDVGRRYPVEEEFAATVACLLAGRMDGQQAVVTLTAIHARFLRAHVTAALAEVESRLALAWDEGWFAGRNNPHETYRRNPYRAARQGPTDD